jgi:hypothetical protein
MTGADVDKAVDSAYQEVELVARRFAALLAPAMEQSKSRPGTRVWGQANISITPPILLAAEDPDDGQMKLDRLHMEEVYQSMSAPTVLEQLDKTARVLMESVERYEAWTRFIQSCLSDSEGRPEGMTDIQLVKTLLPQMMQAELSKPSINIELSPAPFFQLWIEHQLEPALLEKDGEDYIRTRHLWTTAAAWSCRDLTLDHESEETIKDFVVRTVATADLVGSAILAICEGCIPNSTASVMNALDSLRAGR